MMAYWLDEKYYNEVKENVTLLKIKVDKMGPYDGAIDMVFRGNYEDEWFDDPFVKEMVKNVDNSEVVSANLIISPVLGPISYERLSGGVKVLIMLYKMPEMEQCASNCGDNCLPDMVRISEMHDITVKFSHCPDKFPDNVKAKFLDTGEIARGDKEVGLGIIERM